MRLKSADCWIKSVFNEWILHCILLYGPKYGVGIRNRQLSVCQGYCTCIYIGFLQGPFPKSGLDKVSVFPMIGLGNFYCSCLLSVEYFTHLPLTWSTDSHGQYSCLLRVEYFTHLPLTCGLDSQCQYSCLLSVGYFTHLPLTWSTDCHDLGVTMDWLTLLSSVDWWWMTVWLDDWSVNRWLVHWFESFRRLYTINTYALIPNNGSVIGIMHTSYTRNEYDAQTCIMCDVQCGVVQYWHWICVVWGKGLALTLISRWNWDSTVNVLNAWKIIKYDDTHEWSLRHTHLIYVWEIIWLDGEWLTIMTDQLFAQTADCMHDWSNDPMITDYDDRQWMTKDTTDICFLCM